MLEIVRIPALSDNYIWLVHEPVSDETVVIDPAEAAGVELVLVERGWKLSAIWNTHWHPDHTGGNADLKEGWGVPVIAPAREVSKIPTADRLVAEGESVRIGGIKARVLEVPGHTAGHIAYYLPAAGVVFVGDTLFAMGCGRLFEGTPAQMFDNMQRLAKLPGDTQVYCAHEYTLGNARWAATVEPSNQAIRTRLDEIERLRAANEATVPTTLALELETNPFLRARSAEELARLRAAKDRS